jgi:ferredoxin
MATTSERLTQNAVGRYYVDSSCIDCDLCRTTAPAFFTRADELGFSVIHRQPVTPEELELAEEARLGCPTESIGNDGEPVGLDRVLLQGSGLRRGNPSILAGNLRREGKASRNPREISSG